MTQLPDPNDCIQENAGALACGTETGRGINAVVGLTVSADGHNVYATSAGPNGDLAEFARAADGSLTQLASPNDCIEEQGSAEGCGTTDGHGLNGASQVVVSPDDTTMYVATQGDDCCDQAVAEFSRASDGTVTQLPTPDECLGENSGDCSDDSAIGLGGGAVAISADGANVYTTGFSDVAELARTPVQRTLSVSLGGSGTGAVSDGTGAIVVPVDVLACVHGEFRGHAHTGGLVWLDLHRMDRCLHGNGRLPGDDELRPGGDRHVHGKRHSPDGWSSRSRLDRRAIGRD